MFFGAGGKMRGRGGSGVWRGAPELRGTGSEGWRTGKVFEGAWGRGRDTSGIVRGTEPGDGSGHVGSAASRRSGRPKGVEITLGALANHMKWMAEEFGLNKRDCVLQKTPISFDASVWEFYAALLSGGRLVLARGGGHRDAEYLTEMMEREQVTVVQLVPSQLAMLLEGNVEQCRALRLLFCGGEALGAGLVRRLQERRPVEVVNLYGPTEMTIDSTWWRGCEIGEQSWVPIGRPIANVEVYVLDEEGELVPEGVWGELYIGGAGLARGYVNQAGQTAERFVPHGYSEEGGRRLYRSGDRVRWREGGELEYLGRKDEQVKIRGYRIELGEIEAVLGEHGGVGQAVVVVAKEGEGDQRLVAYVVRREGEEGEGRGGERTTKEELRRYVQGRLPEYMVPGEWVWMERMPLTVNGKVDRKGMPKRGEKGREERGEGREGEGGRGEGGARTATEELVAGVWAQVLKRERVGREENFFELGGHSLLATQVVSRVRSVLGVEVGLRSLFENPTVAGLGKHIEEVRREHRGGRKMPALERAAREQALPLSFAQQRLWFIHQLEPDSAAYNCPWAMRLRGELNLEALGRSFDEIVRRHEVLRTSFPAEGGEPVERIGEAERVEIPVIDVSGMREEAREEEARELGRRTGEERFVLETGPVLRVRVVKLGEQEHVLLLTLHHIVSDGWSVGIMVREFSELYEGYAEGRESRLEEPRLQYADYAVWQREWLKGEVLEEQLSYWREELKGLEVLELPTDYGRPAQASHRGGLVPFRLSEELTRGLRGVSQEQGVTLFMTLLAGFQVLLARYSGQKDIAVGTDVANRNWLESEDLPGFFVNQLVLRSRVEGEMRFSELLQQVRGTVLEAYAHQDLPFERLVEELQTKRDLSRTPLFSVKFVLQNIFRPVIRLGSCAVEEIAARPAPAKFDLTLTLEESEGALTGFLHYPPDLFAPSTIGILSEQLKDLLTAIVLTGEAPINTLMQLIDNTKERHLSMDLERMQKALAGKWRVARRKTVAVSL